MKVEQVVRDAAADYLRERGLDCATVTRLEGWGTDWAGDTLGGFHDQFTVDVFYASSDGKAHATTLEGEDLGVFWKQLMQRDAT